jgi:hypothetical protein
MPFIYLTNSVLLVLLLPLFCHIRCLAIEELNQSIVPFILRAHLVVHFYFETKCRLLPHYPQLHTKLKFWLVLPFVLGQLLLLPFLLTLIIFTRRSVC